MRRLRSLGILALLGLVLGACGATPQATTTSTSGTTTTVSGTTTVPQTTTPGSGASQSPADAARDGVIPELAALPYEVRVGVIESVDTDEGTWVLSRPTEAIDAYADDCRLGPDGGQYPTGFICTFEYGEVLLVRDGIIVRAYPLPAVPPQFLVVTDDAAYCARSGEPMLPDAMVCRIDRASLDATVRVFPGDPDSVVVQPCFYPPEHWDIDEQPLEVTGLEVDDQGIRVGGSKLDPMTLEPIVSGSSGRALLSACPPGR